MRTVSSSIMAALVVMALFWGNCFSCPQVLLTLQKQKTSHDCCKRNQKPVTKSCDSQGLQHFVKAAPADAAQIAPALEPAAAVEVASPAVWHAPAASPESGGHAPPDLLSLHSSFRI